MMGKIFGGRGGVPICFSLRWLKLIATLYGKAFNTALEYEEVFISLKLRGYY